MRFAMILLLTVGCAQLDAEPTTTEPIDIETKCCPLLETGSWESQGCMARVIGPNRCDCMYCPTASGEWYSGQVCVHDDGSYEVR